MKIIGIDGNCREGSQEEGGMPGIYLMCDSSLLKDGKPFFVPDFAESFVAYPTIVVQVCRLGKNIARRFAHRYYDRVTVGLSVEAAGMKERFAAGGCGALCRAFDGAAILGEMVDVAAAGDRLEYAVAEGGRECFAGSTAMLQRGIDELIEHVSRYMTLKIGDYIFVSRPQAGVPLRIGMQLAATLAGQEVLRVKVK